MTPREWDDWRVRIENDRLPPVTPGCAYAVALMLAALLFAVLAWVTS